MKHPSLSLLFTACLLCGGVVNAATTVEPMIKVKPYGKFNDQSVMAYTMRNANGVTMEVINYGGIITRLKVPDRDGKLDDVVLGYNKLEDYVKENPYFGAIIGRVGNRIADGKFELGGKTYELAVNNHPGDIGCHLHGGIQGFDKVVWDARPTIENGEPVLELRYTSVDGEEGYPGTLKIAVTYTLTGKNELDIRYWAETDQATPVNLTNHSYFNLRGDGKGDILGHELVIVSDALTPVNAGLIPTGAFMDVTGTPFDFREATPIGARIDAKNEQIAFGLGYDHNWVLKREGSGLELAATVYEPLSGRVMEVYTEEPGIQFYSGNFLDGTLIGKTGVPYAFRSGFCLETQHYPDSPNQAGFPSITLDTGKTYETRTVYRFSAR